MKTLDMYELYDRILQTQESFPLGTWAETDSKQRLQKLLRYLVIDKMKWTKEDFQTHYSLPFLTKYRLATAFRRTYNVDLPLLAQDTFPEWHLRAWTFKKIYVKKSYWNEETMKEATRWIVEEVLQWDLERVNQEISNRPFVENNLNGMFGILKVGAVQAITTTYPDYDWTYLIERRGYKYTHAQIQEIRELYENGMIQADIARKMGMVPTVVCLIVHNRSHKDI